MKKLILIALFALSAFAAGAPKIDNPIPIIIEDAR